MQDRRLALGVALCDALIGLPYLLHAFGPTEAEVAQWGLLALVGGLALAGLSFALTDERLAALKLLAAAGYGFLVLMQVLPVILWPLFHGSGISDGSPPSDFVAHWAYALPHAALLVANVLVMWRLLRSVARAPSHG
ncbi:MAG: hypothetical protein GX552_11750 [Chloroflexi bacterium]|jgi:hypothetical protein|nr:hypothetical protein [Chloroflexota bacterium]